MTARKPESIAADLTVPERVPLFCLASDTDWVKAGVTHATAQHMLVKNLVERDHGARMLLTDQGGAVLSALMARSGPVRDQAYQSGQVAGAAGSRQ